MSFLTTKLLSLLLYPLTQGLLLLLLALVFLCFGRRALAYMFTAFAFSWLYLMSTPWMGGQLMGALEASYPPVPVAELPQADAIVLLGGGVRARVDEHSLGNLNRWGDRILYAAVLYQAGKAPRIVVTGGGRENGDTEAELMRDILNYMGVPEQAVVLETASTTTYDNARFTVPILRENNWEKVLLVTSAFHMRRSEALFKAQGMTVTVAPTDHQTAPVLPTVGDYLPSLSGLSLTTYALHEWLGYQVYAWRGWL